MAATTLLSDNGVTSGITGYQLTGGNDGTLQLQTTTAGGTATTAMTIDSSQNVGIGTSSPVSKLHVYGITSQSVSVGAATKRIDIGYNTTTDIGEIHSADFGTAEKPLKISGNYIAFGAGIYSNPEVMRIDSSGNVGIGVSSISEKFEVGATSSGYSTGTFTANGNYGAGIAVSTNNKTNSWFIGARKDVYGGSAGTDRFNILYGTTAVATIDTSGNLLVGATSVPSVSATTGTGISLSPAGAGMRSNLTPGNEGFSINYTSYINGTTVYPIVFRTNGTTVGYISYTNTAVAYVTSSDYRLKEDVLPMQNALAKIATLNPVTYKWKSDGTDGQGFIAHELQAVIPECVTGEKDAVDADGNPVYQGIDTSFLVATLTAAIQELKAIVDAQAVEIAALKGQA